MAFGNRLKSRTPKKTKSRIGRTLLIIFILVLMSGGGIGAIILFETEKPLISLSEDIQHIGREARIPFEVSDHKQGVRSVTVSIEQNGKSSEIYQKTYPRSTWYYGAGPALSKGIIEFDSKQTKLKDGEAELIVTTRDFSLNNMLKGNTSTSRYSVTIDTRSPRITLEHSQRYMLPGGSGIVTYDISEPVKTHGVYVNELFFQGYPLPDHENRYIAYIALAWDTDKIEGSRVVARDMAGNEGKAVFSIIKKKAAYKHDRINVSDAFLEAKIPEFEQYYPEMHGSILNKYLYANNDIRRLNSEAIKKLCSTSGQTRLWKDRFLRMPGASKASFADQRTYYYQGKDVDQQVHLGMDIASTAAIEIKAANRGKVIFADYLGIYGNTVILDHGQGLFSLYSHLSRIKAEVEEIVDQGTIIGRSGATGMAGGDHLHFSILIQGMFVTPVEWWDQHWIDVNINDVLDQL